MDTTEGCIIALVLPETEECGVEKGISVKKK